MDKSELNTIGLSLRPRSEIFKTGTNMHNVTPVVSIHPDKLVCYNQYEGKRRKSYSSNPFKQVPEDNRHGGNISSKAERKIKKAINYLSTISTVKPLNSWKHQKVFKYRLAFVTLTLPSTQIHDDKTIMKSIFHQFLVVARKKWKMNNYVWRAEKQKNGNIHFHVLIDRYIDWSELRDTWNNICNKLGYVDRYREQMKEFHSAGFRLRDELLKKWSYKNQVKAYHAGVASDWRSPNSTDVHGIKKVSNIAAYVCKYMVKSSQADESLSRLWGCSYELSRARGAVLEIDSYVNDALQVVLEKLKPLVIIKDYVCIYYIKWFHLAREGTQLLYDEFVSYIQSQFNVNIACGM